MNEDPAGPLPEEFFEPSPREPKTIKELLERIEHNTAVIKVWIRVFGIVWVITTIIWVVAAMSRGR